MTLQYRVQNPVNNQIVQTFDSATDAEIDEFLSKASSAYHDWSSRHIGERAEITAKVASLFEERKIRTSKDCR